MAAQTVLEITADNFDEIVNAETPTLVDFWAPWCGPCRALGPTIDKLAEDFEGKAQVGKLNIDEHPQLAAKFGVSSIPTVMVFKSGDQTDQFVGLRQYNDYADALSN
jgi:thioredoxin 1